MIDLVVPAAQAVVSAMTTSAWNDTHAKLTSLFGRHKDTKQLRVELDSSHTRLTADPSREEREIAHWMALFSSMAETAPDSLAAVVDVLNEVSPGTPGTRVRQTGFALQNQYNVAGNLIQRG